MHISFVYPQFLFALFLIAIPVIIHLFDFRRFKKIPFTNVAFLQELREQTTSTSRLRNLLVLLSRILAFIFLVLAFARPYNNEDGQRKVAASRVVSMYLDNSFSMESINSDGTLLDVARARALQIAGTFRPTDKFNLVTNDFDPAQQRLVNREEFITMVQDVRPGPYTRKLSEVIARQNDQLLAADAEEKLSFLLSDFQTSMVDFQSASPDTAVKNYLLPLAATNITNAAVDSVWLVSPVVKAGEPCQIKARIRNAGEEDLEAISVNLLLGGVKRSVATAAVNAGGFTDVDLSYTPEQAGWTNGKVTITDSPVTFDDSYYISVNVTESVNVLCIYEQDPSVYLNALYKADPFINYNEQQLTKLDYGMLKKNDLVILSELKEVPSGLVRAITDFVYEGGSAVLVPDSAMDVTSVNTLMAAMQAPQYTALYNNEEMARNMALEDPLFTGVFDKKSLNADQLDLPSAQRFFTFSNKGAATVGLITLRSGNPLLQRTQHGRGKLYQLAVPFSGTASNFSRHAVFVPVMYRMAILSRNSEALGYIIGNDAGIALSNAAVTGEPVFHLVNKELGIDVIPAARNTGNGVILGINNQIKDAGTYDLMSDNGIIRPMSFNYNRAESVLKFKDEADLMEEAGKAGFTSAKAFDAGKTEMAAVLSAIGDDAGLWKDCILLALLFILIEMLLLKFWKK